MKRRCMRIYMAFILVLLLSTSAYAVNAVEYELEELGLTVSMPSDYVVFTRNISANDPNLGAYSLTKDGLSSLMTERNIYLNGWDEDVNQEIIFTMIDSPLVDFNLYSDTTLATMATSFVSGYADMGVTVIKSGVYQHSQAKFLKIYISQPNGDSTAYGLQYYTVYADKAINITLQSYSGQITSSQESTLKGVVDSVKFDTAPQTGEADFTATNAFDYTDIKTQTTFTVPANWVETSLSEERETTDVKFTSLEEDGMSILYGSFDIWGEMAASERSGYSRSDIDNSIFTKTDIADALGLSVNDISTIKYAGNEYYTATITSNTETYGLTFSVTVTHMIAVNNGYMYWFQFSGAKDNAYFGDFESLLSSVKYPNQNSKIATESNVTSDLINQFSLGNILLSLMITIAVYSLPIIIYRYAIRTDPVEKKKAKKITIIYGICAFIAMSIIIFAINGSGAAGGAILLWSWVNYRVLIGGKKNPIVSGNGDSATLVESISDADQTDSFAQMDVLDNFTPSNKPQEKVCHNCGAAMPTESKYCHKCGTKM